MTGSHHKEKENSEQLVVFFLSVFSFTSPYCVIFHVKGQSKFVSTTFWKLLQKRAVWFPWQYIYKSLIILIPFPVDFLVDLTVAYYHSARKW